MDGCSQDKEVPHVRTGDGRHTGLPRPLPRPRRPSGPLRRPVGDPGTCAARRATPYADTAWGRFGSLSWWHPSARASRARPVWERCNSNPVCPDCLPRRSPAWPLRAKTSPMPGSRPTDVAKNPQSPQAASRFHIPVFHAVSVPHTGGRPPYTPAAFHKFTKNHKPASPRFAGHTAAYAWPLPTRLGSPILLPSPKNPDIGFGETSVPAPQIPNRP